MSSFLVAEQKALDIAVQAHSGLGALLAGDKIYSGLAPEGTLFDYLTISDIGANERNLFMKQGQEARYTISIWTKENGLMSVGLIYDQLDDLLHRKKLTLEDGTMIKGKLDLVLSGLGDPSDTSIVKGIATWRIWVCQ